MNRSAWQFDLPPEPGEVASQLAHPMHDRLAAGSEPAACEADRVTQLPECSVVVEGFGRTWVPDCFERSVNASELLEEADVGVLARPWPDVIAEPRPAQPSARRPSGGRSGKPEPVGRRPLAPAGGVPASAAVPRPARGGPRACEPGGQPAAQRLSAR